MSICVAEGANDALAEHLGMDVTSIENYQFVIREKFSTTEKKEMLKQLMPELTTHYADDAFKYEDAVPVIHSIVDSKDFN